jgi:uncharacterized membrane-anchored protein YhcB (DUF1043 family)
MNTLKHAAYALAVFAALFVGYLAGRLTTYQQADTAAFQKYLAKELEAVQAKISAQRAEETYISMIKQKQGS